MCVYIYTQRGLQVKFTPVCVHRGPIQRHCRMTQFQIKPYS